MYVVQHLDLKLLNIMNYKKKKKMLKFMNCVNLLENQ